MITKTGTRSYVINIDGHRTVINHFQYQDINEGRLCPNCFSTDIKRVGSNPDGRYMNHAYDCIECGFSWEGF